MNISSLGYAVVGLLLFIHIPGNALLLCGVNSVEFCRSVPLHSTSDYNLPEETFVGNNMRKTYGLGQLAMRR